MAACALGKYSTEISWKFTNGQQVACFHLFQKYIPAVSALREYNRSLSTLQEQTKKDLNAEICAIFPETIALTCLIFRFQSTTKKCIRDTVKSLARTHYIR